MNTIETMRGPVATESLGMTLIHEHIFTVSPDYVANYGVGNWWDEQERVADAITKLHAARDAGVRTLVDHTVLGGGRDIRRLLPIAEAVPDLNIVVATGLYTFDEVPHQYEFRGPGQLWDVPEPMVGDFVRDLTEGIAGTGVKAALIKFCVEARGVTPGIERIAGAVAEAHRETGAPISVHTDAAARSGLPALDLLEKLGVNPARVLISHAGDSDDLGYLRRLADRGALLGMDRFGLDIYQSPQVRLRTVVELAEAGYARRMALSHDATCFSDYLGCDPEPVRAQFTPNWRYTHVPLDVLPALRERGLDEDRIRQMTHYNASIFLTRGV